MHVDLWLGWDSDVPRVSEVAAYSAQRRSSLPLNIHFLKQDELVRHGLYWRSVDPLASTEFTYTRFLTPHLSPDADIAIFADNDILWQHDIADLIEAVDFSRAVHCVKHDHRPIETMKMDGRIQSRFPRKNWSSLMVFNMRDERLRELTVDRVNTESGAYLHRMKWLDDDAIGALDPRWNWLEGSSPMTDDPFAIHFTRGGPWLEAWRDVAFAERWFLEERLMLGRLEAVD